MCNSYKVFRYIHAHMHIHTHTHYMPRQGETYIHIYSTLQRVFTQTVARRPASNPHIVMARYIRRLSLLTATNSTTMRDTNNAHFVTFNLQNKRHWYIIINYTVRHWRAHTEGKACRGVKPRSLINKRPNKLLTSGK